MTRDLCSVVMSGFNILPWSTLERRGGRLFLLAGAILLVAAANYAVPFFLEGVEFNAWIGLTVLLGRLVSLLAVAGLVGRILARSRRLGLSCQVIVVAAVLFATGLLSTAILENLGYAPPLMAVFGLGTILLSIVTYTIFGVAILRTGAYSTLIGTLLLVATAALLFGFLSQMVLPERLIGLIGTVAEIGLVLANAGIGYQLWTERGRGGRAEPAAETVSK